MNKWNILILVFGIFFLIELVEFLSLYWKILYMWVNLGIEDILGKLILCIFLSNIGF